MSKQVLQELLFKLESLWESQDAPILSKLSPGIKNMVGKVSSFTGVLPREVNDLYNWRNGVSPTEKDLIGNLIIFPGGIFLPFEKAEKIQIAMAGDEFGWDSNKFVLFENGGGEYTLIEGDPNNNLYGSILYHSIGAVEFKRIISIYDSIYSLFLTIYECFEKGAYKYEQGFLEIDNKKERKIAKKINTHSDYWKID